MTEKTPCCPDRKRSETARTVLGVAVYDLHWHKGLLRGYVAEDSGDRLLHWYGTGRLTPATQTDYDLRRAG